MKKTILLTGGSGFVGLNLIKDLITYYKLYVIVRKKDSRLKKIKNKNLNIVSFNSPKNFKSFFKKKKIDFVIHCATHYCKTHNFEDLEKMSVSNILLGNVILDLNKYLKYKKFINFTTVWENYNGKLNNAKNLYSSYKQSFSKILDYYKKIYPRSKFYNIFLSETFGNNDRRKKIIQVLKQNYKNNKTSKVVSKKLSMNLLNVKDICSGVNIILKKKVMPGNYLMCNKENVKVSNLVKLINSTSHKKIKVQWSSNINLKEKIYKYKMLPFWRPNNSKIKDLAKFIIN